ncbi:hypothetical protein HMPREF0519_0246, partial [Lentilactobacillus hilgardii DSM 20176 = ATCC 8290]
MSVHNEIEAEYINYQFSCATNYSNLLFYLSSVCAVRQFVG